MADIAAGEDARHYEVPKVGRFSAYINKAENVPRYSAKAKRENAKTPRQAEGIILARTENMVDDKAQEEATD